MRDEERETGFPAEGEEETREAEQEPSFEPDSSDISIPGGDDPEDANPAPEPPRH